MLSEASSEVGTQNPRGLPIAKKPSHYPLFHIFISSSLSKNTCVHVPGIITCVLSRVWPLCCPMDCSPPGFSVHGILQARMLEWVAISYSRGSSQPRNRTWVSCTAGRFFIDWAIREAKWDWAKSWLCLLLAVWPWASYLTSLSPSNDLPFKTLKIMLTNKALG